MQSAPPLSLEDAAQDITLALHTQIVERAIQTMQTHLYEVLTLEDLADVACLSPSHFQHVFRRLIGVPPGEFLAALRFRTARHLLLTTPLSVTDICFEVGYTSTGSFTSRFTQLVGMSPRLLRQRAHAFEPLPVAPVEGPTAIFPPLSRKRVLEGKISAPATFRGTIYVGLFKGPIPQGAPVRCTRLGGSGGYRFQGIADGVYHLRAAAFPLSSDLQSALLPGDNQLLGNNPGPVIMRHGNLVGNPNLILHKPRLTDPPLVMGLPLL